MGRFTAKTNRGEFYSTSHGESKELDDLQSNAKLFVDDEGAITEKHKGKTLRDDEGDGDGADVNSIALKIDSSLFVSEEGDGKPKATEEGTIKVDASLFT